MRVPSVRAEVTARRTYHRPHVMQDESKGFETWPQVIDRVMFHTRWLWERAQKSILTEAQNQELAELQELMLDRAVLPSGRTMWLGGTRKAREREASQFNCAFTEVQSIYDLVDFFWLLLQGCGVGGRPVVGSLYSFSTSLPKLTVIPSVRTDKGRPTNYEAYDKASGVWTIQVGDSAEAWAKSVGKLLAGKHVGCKELVLDFSEIRPAGKRLEGYGWICHGYKPLAFAYEEIFKILNRHPGQCLTYGQIHDILNLLGTVLSSRRSAELMLCDARNPAAADFVRFKQGMDDGPWWRCQSNNTIEFLDWDGGPGFGTIYNLLLQMKANGGSEPGIRNGDEARRRAPWSRGTNPCAEILLPNKGFCNLVEVNVAHPRFTNGIDGWIALKRATRLIARFNYRQTCVNLEDGILQRAWHENNQNLRLCGVGLTGLALRADLDRLKLAELRNEAHKGASSMAHELGTQLPALVTTVKPSGTLSKVMDTTEGFHQPLGRYIFNRIGFGPHDSSIPKLIEAGYKVEAHPSGTGYLVVLPVDYGVDIKEETAVEQLYRYLNLMQSWCDHNVSCTIYYEEDELHDIAAWLDAFWNHFVAVSFLPRKSNQTYSYMPQTVVSREEYEAYASTLKPITFDVQGSLSTDDEACATGACPVR